jgi:hypothetical protein
VRPLSRAISAETGRLGGQQMVSRGIPLERAGPDRGHRDGECGVRGEGSRRDRVGCEQREGQAAGTHSGERETHRSPAGRSVAAPDQVEHRLGGVGLGPVRRQLDGAIQQSLGVGIAADGQVRLPQVPGADRRARVHPERLLEQIDRVIPLAPPALDLPHGAQQIGVARVLAARNVELGQRPIVVALSPEVVESLGEVRFGEARSQTAGATQRGARGVQARGGAVVVEAVQRGVGLAQSRPACGEAGIQPHRLAVQVHGGLDVEPGVAARHVLGTPEIEVVGLATRGAHGRRRPFRTAQGEVQRRSHPLGDP